MLSLIIKGRGSQSLAGAASLKHRVPMVRDCFPRTRSDIAQLGRATARKAVSRRFESCYRSQAAENGFSFVNR
jgi:hypothetical protein